MLSRCELDEQGLQQEKQKIIMRISETRRKHLQDLNDVPLVTESPATVTPAGSVLLPAASPSSATVLFDSSSSTTDVAVVAPDSELVLKKVADNAIVESRKTRKVVKALSQKFATSSSNSTSTSQAEGETPGSS